jgi:hypothetical protein
MNRALQQGEAVEDKAGFVAMYYGILVRDLTPAEMAAENSRYRPSRSSNLRWQMHWQPDAHLGERAGLWHASANA